MCIYVLHSMYIPSPTVFLQSAPNSWHTKHFLCEMQDSGSSLVPKCLRMMYKHMHIIVLAPLLLCLFTPHNCILIEVIVHDTNLSLLGANELLY